MEVVIKKDGKEWKVRVGVPSFARREAVRRLTAEFVERAQAIDELYKDAGDDARQIVDKAAEVERLTDEFTVRYFKAIADGVPEELRSDFESEWTSEFWQQQDAVALEEAFRFFRTRGGAR